MQFSIIAALAIAAASVQAVDVVGLGNDIAKLDSGVTALLKLVKATDGSDLSADLKINTSAQKLNTVVLKTAKDAPTVPAKSINDNLVKGIIKTLQGTEANTKAICKKLAADRDGYNAAGVPPFVYASTQALASSVKKVGKALVGVATTNTKDLAQSLADDFNADLKICTDAYKNYDY